MDHKSAVMVTPAPWFLVTPPECDGVTVERDRVTAMIDDSVTRHRITAISAPAGSGKTVALSHWARTRPAATSVAWLSLTRFDISARHILCGVLTALGQLTANSGPRWDEASVVADAKSPSIDDAHRALLDACNAFAEPVTLVVDDVHWPEQALAESVLATLIDVGPPTLRIVLAGRVIPAAVLSRALVSGQVSIIEASDFAFTESEIRQAAAALDREVSPTAAEDLRRSTDGWASAVRLSLMAPPHSVGQEVAVPRLRVDSDPLLTDYIETQIVDQLPTALASFVLATTCATDIDAALAAAVSGRDDSAALLDECVRRGLFLDRLIPEPGAGVGYRWHSVFARHCRVILARRDHEQAHSVERLAANELSGRNPLEAVDHALRGDDPAMAVRIIGEQWLSLVLQSRADLLDRACRDLPEPWSGHAQILHIRACCQDVLGDRTAAALLTGRANTATDDSGASVTLVLALATLMVADAHATLLQACDQVHSALGSARDVPPSLYASALFMLGWTEMRLRRDPARAAQLLRSAMTECEAAGQHFLARNCGVNLAFALAFRGDFTAARGSLDELTSPAGHESQQWQTYDGGIEMFAAGFIDYWQANLADALTTLRAVVAAPTTSASYRALARVYLALVAASTGRLSLLSEAEAEAARIPDTPEHGMPWPTYKLLARAKLAEARGDHATALAMARLIGQASHVPVATALVAELYRRLGQPDQARALLRTLPAAVPQYTRVSSLVTEAALRWDGGNRGDAHRLLEAALDLAEPEGVARPFSSSDSTLHRLLVAHATAGTRHGDFLAARIAGGDDWRDLDTGPTLTKREREILTYLRTPLTGPEIAKTLNLSINTVKSHQRTIYRKLGVDSRREAMRIAL
ncbi:LuxR C-terminal-related transcriptional regulator [Rhodococcus kronopolitis]|uniref:LuxR C-terminal-related transcriptional regulator n=1 Tax=Rhodococcus kronopolitis TaxID=1460226 RepID=A0ABV9FSY2_9NOCA